MIGEEDCNQDMIVDLRWTVGKLREKLAEKMGLPLDGFHVFTDLELKDVKQVLSAAGFKSDTEVFVQLGRPLSVGEYNFNVYKPFDDAKMITEEHPFDYLGNLVLDENWSLARVREEVAKMPRAPPKNRMRIRDHIYSRLTYVYLDTKTLKGNCKGIKDFRDIVVEETVTEEKFTEDHLLLSIAIWDPFEKKLGPLREMAILGTASLSEVKAEFDKSLGLPKNFIKITKPLPYILKEIDKIPSLDWNMAEGKDESTLRDRYWKAKNGDILLLKDGQIAEERVDVPKEAPKHHSEEVGFKIYSAEERKEIQRKKTEKEEVQKVEQDKARDDAVARATQKTS